jgi:hypothetical protein
MWATKGCPKCKGDLFIYCSNKARVETCLQCGFEREIINYEKAGKPSVAEGDICSSIQRIIR